jgi:plastocyanin
MPELLVTMTTPGTFGYQCEFHPTTMFGAIQVVP